MPGASSQPSTFNIGSASFEGLTGSKGKGKGKIPCTGGPSSGGHGSSPTKGKGGKDLWANYRPSAQAQSAYSHPRGREKVASGSGQATRYTSGERSEPYHKGRGRGRSAGKGKQGYVPYQHRRNPFYHPEDWPGGEKGEAMDT